MHGHSFHPISNTFGKEMGGGRGGGKEKKGTMEGDKIQQVKLEETWCGGEKQNKQKTRRGFLLVGYFITYI